MPRFNFMKNSFSKKDIGAAVVFAGFDGGSYSATIKDVTAELVCVEYFPLPSLLPGVLPQPVSAFVKRQDWRRLTRFGTEKFMVLA